MKYLLVLLLIGCTPQGQLQTSRQAQDSTQDQSSAQALSHASRTSDMPIIIICNHVGTGASECIRRTVPMGEITDLTK